MKNHSYTPDRKAFIARPLNGLRIPATIENRVRSEDDNIPTCELLGYHRPSFQTAELLAVLHGQLTIPAAFEEGGVTSVEDGSVTIVAAAAPYEGRTTRWCAKMYPHLLKRKGDRFVRFTVYKTLAGVYFQMRQALHNDPEVPDIGIRSSLPPVRDISVFLSRMLTKFSGIEIDAAGFDRFRAYRLWPLSTFVEVFDEMQGDLAQAAGSLAPAQLQALHQITEHEIDRSGLARTEAGKVVCRAEDEKDLHDSRRQHAGLLHQQPVTLPRNQREHGQQSHGRRPQQWAARGNQQRHRHAVAA